MNEKRLIWAGAVLDPSGYGEASRGYVMGLAKHQDITTKLIARNFWTGDPPDLRKQWDTLNALSKNNFDRRQPHIFLQHVTPDQYMLSGGDCKYHIGMTTFETTSLPSHWQIPMRAMDEIFTFSDWSKEVFQGMGIRRQVTVTPHGVDVVKFNPGVEPLAEVRATLPPDTFIFGSNFDWTERKNPTALLKAYFTSFTRKDPVALLLKCYYQYPIEHSEKFIRGYIDEVRTSLKLTAGETPRIILLGDIMPGDWLPQFYATLDAYVLPSRGEGWGLTYSEAMATGLPTIAVNWSGHTQFMNQDNSFLCNNFQMKTVTDLDAGFQKQYVGHKWADVDPDELAQHMQWIYSNRDAARAVGVKARETMVEKFTWANAARIIKTRLDQIFADV